MFNEEEKWIPYSSQHARFIKALAKYYLLLIKNSSNRWSGSLYFFVVGQFSENQKKNFKQKMVFKAQMIYVLVDTECNYTLKHVFDDNISYFTNYTAHLSQL